MNKVYIVRENEFIIGIYESLREANYFALHCFSKTCQLIGFRQIAKISNGMFFAKLNLYSIYVEQMQIE